MKTKKTDHSYLKYKIQLRLDNLPDANIINVLDLFAGSGRIWQEIIKKRRDKTLNVLPIDRKKDLPGSYLMGDNIKFLSRLNLRAFHAIDLDAYDCPIQALSAILRPNRAKPGTFIYVTWIQSLYGALPTPFLLDLGYSRKMVKKCPTLLYRHGQKKLLNWLWTKGIRSIKMYYTEDRRKTYLCFQIEKG